MVKIQLDKKYYLKSNKHEWILAIKEGKGTRSLYYYPTIEHSLKDYIGIALRCSNATSISELLKILDSVVAGLNQALAPLNIKVSKGDTNES